MLTDKEFMSELTIQNYQNLVYLLRKEIDSSYPSRKDFCNVAHIDPANLSRILSFQPCSVLTFIRLCLAAGLSITYENLIKFDNA